MKKFLLAVFSMVLMASSFSHTYAAKYWVENLKINQICHQTNDNHAFICLKTPITKVKSGTINGTYYSSWDINNKIPSPYLFSASTTTNKLIYAGLLNAYATESYVNIQFEDYAGATRILWVLVHK